MARPTERLERHLDDVLSALAGETPYALVRTLVAAGEELRVCELQAVVDASESGHSHALSNLVGVPVLLALVYVAQYFRRRFDWSGPGTGRLGADREQTTDD